MKRIFIVVDDHEARRGYYDAFFQAYIVVEVVQSGELALKILERGAEADLFLVDLDARKTLDGIDSIEFMRITHRIERLSQALFVVVNEGTLEVKRQKLLEEIDVTYVPKSRNQVRDVVDKLMSGRPVRERQSKR